MSIYSILILYIYTLKHNKIWYISEMMSEAVKQWKYSSYRATQTHFADAQ